MREIKADLLFISNNWNNVGVDQLYHLDAIRNDAALTKDLGLDQLSIASLTCILE